MPGRNAIDRAGFGPLAFRENQHREAVREHLADVAQRLPRAGLALRQRKRVEEQRREIVVQAVGEPRAARPCSRGKEMRLEEFLAPSPARRGSASARGSAAMITGPSMWLWWFARRSPGRRDRAGARALRRAATRTRARAAGSRSAGSRGGRRARASARFHDGKVDRLGRRRVARRRALDERAQLPEIARARRTRPRRCASGTRPRARPSARRDRASSARAPRASSAATRSLAAGVFRDQRGERVGRPAAPARGAAPPLFTQSRIAARFSLRVPSVRGSSGSGQTSARRIFW